MKQRVNFHVACYLILEKDNKILLQKRQNSGYFDGYYSVPAGHLEEKETCIDCIIRETKEEIGIDIKREDTNLIFTSDASKKNNYICLFFKTNKFDGDIKIMEPEKCSELRFFDIDNLPENLVPELRTFLEDRKKGLIYGIERSIN